MTVEGEDLKALETVPSNSKVPTDAAPITT